MSSHTDQLKSVLGLSALLSFYGIASLIVWFLGSQYGLSVSQTIVLIVLLLVTLPFVLIFAYLIKRRAKKKEAAAPSADQQAAVPLASPTGTYQELTSGAEETVQW